jgi:HSP20 family protein
MATSMQRRSTPSTFGLFPLLTRDIDLLQSNMRRLFQGGPSGRGDVGTDLPQALTWVPPVEISETPDELVITAEIPGIAADEVHVMVDGDTLTIRGEKQNERREGDDDTQYFLVERSYGVFQRSFTLPNTVDPDSIQADFNNGVLTLRLKKVENARGRGREIPVGSSGTGTQGRVGGGAGQSRGGSAGAQGGAQTAGARTGAQSGGAGSEGQSRAASAGGSGDQSRSGSGRGGESQGRSGASGGAGSHGGTSSSDADNASSGSSDRNSRS